MDHAVLMGISRVAVALLVPALWAVLMEVIIAWWCRRGAR